eukprot:scaffold10230_cov23-Cyclotella_meneghiniana.AAC.1
MLSSYFANYLPLSRHHRTHKNGPRDDDSPNPLPSSATSHSTTTIYCINHPLDNSSYQTYPYPAFGGLKSTVLRRLIIKEMLCLDPIACR